MWKGLFIDTIRDWGNDSRASSLWVLAAWNDSFLFDGHIQKISELRRHAKNTAGFNLGIISIDFRELAILNSSLGSKASSLPLRWPSEFPNFPKPALPRPISSIPPIPNFSPQKSNTSPSTIPCPFLRHDINNNNNNNRRPCAVPRFIPPRFHPLQKII